MSDIRPNKRAHWIGGIAKRGDEMERVDEEWWLSSSHTERLLMTAELSMMFDWSGL